MVKYDEEVRRRIKIMLAYLDGATIQIKGLDHDPDLWVTVGGTQFDNWETHDYRIKPAEPVVPDTIDWSAVHPRFNFMARDEDDQVWLFIGEPKLREGEGFWESTSGDACRGDTLASYKNGGLPWYESLVARP